MASRRDDEGRRWARRSRSHRSTPNIRLAEFLQFYRSGRRWCQHENPPQSRFCFECGAHLASTCSSCGAELPAGVKFGNQCGQAAAGQAPAKPSLVSPETYTPNHLADRDPEEARKLLDPVLELMMDAVHTTRAP
ncbi:MAG TPA: zinc ribbon domain-containing protein [Methylomirabilota bacterium]|nr:zinc ribbon domain-containing protein [Methylomirabilota bacterium]